MASGSGSETKSVLVSVFGPTLSTPEDEQAKVNPVSLHSDKSNTGTDYTKSRLEAIFGPEFYSECLSPGPSSDDLVTGCQITDDILDESTPVEKLVSTLEDQCNEALDTTQLIPVMQRAKFLQRRVRISRSEEGVSPTPGHAPTRPAGQVLSQIEQRFQDLTEKEVVPKEEFDAFRRDVMQFLGRISDEVRCHHKFQRQVLQRVVPRIVLCSKGEGTFRKILKTLKRGRKSVRLHMLCEQEGEEHMVHDAPGCELHLKKGESLEAIYPFLNHGLRVLHSVIDVAMRPSCVEENLVFSAHAWLQEFSFKIVQSNGTYNTSPTPQAAAAQAAASKGAEQWLVNHLTGRDKMQDFGLQRMVFEKPNGSQPEGTIVWLCKEHAENGKDSHLLTNLPTLG